MGGPAARARELIQGNVGPEPSRIVRRERVAHSKPQGGGGGVPRKTWHTSARVGVLVSGDGRRPKGVVGAVGGVEEGVFIGPGQRARRGAAFRFPVLGPQGKGAFPSDGLGMSRGLNPVKGRAGGEAASRECLVMNSMYSHQGRSQG